MEEREGRREVEGGKKGRGEREKEKKFSSFHREFFRDQRNDVLSWATPTGTEVSQGWAFLRHIKIMFCCFWIWWPSRVKSQFAPYCGKGPCTLKRWASGIFSENRLVLVCNGFTLHLKQAFISFSEPLLILCLSLPFGPGPSGRKLISAHSLFSGIGFIWRRQRRWVKSWMDFSVFCLLDFYIKWERGSTWTMAFWDKLMEKISGELGRHLHRIK